MNDQIFETVITTVDSAGVGHVAPMGVRYRSTPDGRPGVVLMPFKPSTTLANIVATGCAVLNLVTDTRVFAACVTGRRDAQVLALLPAQRVAGLRLGLALRHVELQLVECRDDDQRPRLHLAAVHEAEHAPFIGLNRAQAAVIEGAVLVSRLQLLPADKIRREMAYLQIAIDKTAGAAEHEAWRWLREAVAERLPVDPDSETLRNTP
ncbi:MAG: DUF447 family protein [Burkholderiaceae bacterium]|nr:DUF447 family protein [Burkholderiaceae bacterium]